MPAETSTCAMIADVVVFPCVPTMTTLCLPASTSEPKAAGKLICGIPLARAALASGFTRRITLPMMIRSGFAAAMFSGAYGVITSTPQAASMSLIGG